MHSTSRASFFTGACLFFFNHATHYTFLAVSERTRARARSFHNAIASPQHEFSRTAKATKFIQTRFAYQIRNNDVCVDALGIKLLSDDRKQRVYVRRHDSSCRANRKLLGHAKHRRDIFAKVVHSPPGKVQAQGKSPLCFLPETEKRKVF